MKNMNTIAAIDIGSNAVRFLISNIEEDSDKKCRKVAFLRVPVRLGEDAFTSGTISPERRARPPGGGRRGAGEGRSPRQGWAICVLPGSFCPRPPVSSGSGWRGAPWRAASRPTRWSMRLLRSR